MHYTTQTRLFLFLLVCCHLSLHAQYTVPGKITLTDGQYLEGQINYTDWTIPPNQVTITPTYGRASSTYNLSDLQQVEVRPVGQSAKLYRVFQVQYDTSNQRIEMMDRDPQAKLRTATVLLRQAVVGDLDLFVLTDETSRQHFFVQIRDSTPIELLKKRYLSPTGDSIYTNARYQKQLAYLLSGSAELSQEAAKVEYTESAISNLLVRYVRRNYFMNSLDFVVVNDRPRSQLAWGLTSGAYFTMPFFKRETFRATSITWQPAWAAGPYLELWMPRGNRRWSYRSELLYSNYRSYVILEQKTYNANTVEQRDSANLALRWNNFLRLGSPANSVNRFFGGVGFGVGYLRNLHRNSKRVARFAGIENINYTNEIFPKPPIELSTALNAGFQRGRWGLEARFDYIFGNLLFRQNYLYPTRRYSFFVLASFQISKPQAWHWRRWPSPNYSW